MDGHCKNLGNHCGDGIMCCFCECENCISADNVAGSDSYDDGMGDGCAHVWPPRETPFELRCLKCGAPGDI